VNHVKNWRVPMLVVHGQQDFRIPVEQGIGVFTALQRQGIPSQFLYFPDENHWVLKPANSVQWHDTVNAWLKQYIGQ
ncbi:MAG TPA: prolyl oligopeptidase family serine peptidase, partial [Lysobacter sp.]